MPQEKLSPKQLEDLLFWLIDNTPSLTEENQRHYNAIAESARTLLVELTQYLLYYHVVGDLGARQPKLLRNLEERLRAMSSEIGVMITKEDLNRLS